MGLNRFVVGFLGITILPEKLISGLLSNTRTRIRNVNIFLLAAKEKIKKQFVAGGMDTNGKYLAEMLEIDVQKTGLDR